MKKIIILIIITVLITAGYLLFFSKSNNWTLVGQSTKQGKYRIDGFKTSKTCLEKALELSQVGDYYNCGKSCIDDSTTVDGIRCKEYCGAGGCSKVK